MSCCCDAENCVICEDNFDRTDGTDIDTGSSCGWTEQSGAWEILSNRLRNTSTGIATCDILQPGVPANYITVTIWGDTTGDQARVVLNWEDGSNYDYVAVTFSATGGQLLIREVVGGVGNTLASTAANLNVALSTNHSLTVCLRDGDCAAILVHGAMTTKLNTALDGESGSSVGLSTNTANIVEFDDWSFEKNDSILTGCNHCGLVPTEVCDNCESDEATSRYQIVVTGIKKSQHCRNCESLLNGTFIMEPIDCLAIQFVGSICGDSPDDNVALEMDDSVGVPPGIVEFRMNYSIARIGHIHNIIWEISGTPNCLTFQNELMLLTKNFDGASGCDISEAEVRITTLASP